MRVWLHRLALGALLLEALLLPHPPGGTALSPPQSSSARMVFLPLVANVRPPPRTSPW